VSGSQQAVTGISRGPTLANTVELLALAELPTEDLTEAHCDHFFFAGPASRPTGLVGVELFGDVALLRSLVVVAERRGRGEGFALLDYAEGYSRARGVRQLYLLTTTAEGFFTKHGYARATRESAPPEIRATREFAGICPANSAFMVRQL
jgi:amino-acid N-acetyltransferase